MLLLVRAGVAGLIITLIIDAGIGDGICTLPLLLLPLRRRCCYPPSAPFSTGKKNILDEVIPAAAIAAMAAVTP